MSDLVGNPEDLFSHNEAQMMSQMSSIYFLMFDKESIYLQLLVFNKALIHFDEY